MKRLVLIRHAKTEQEGYERDFSRKLLPRGIDDATNIANSLKERNIIPQQFLSSPAERTIHTSRIFASILSFSEKRIVENKNLYFEYTTQQFIDMIHETSNNVDCLFVVGHNPSMHYIAQNLCVGYDGHTPTCSTVAIDFEVSSWADVEPRKGLLFLHLYPKNNK